MATYTNAGQDTLGTMQDVMERYHPELVSAEVAVEILIAWGTKDETGQVTTPAIRVNRVRAVGSIRITSLKERVADRGDAEMLLDGDQLDGMQPKTLEAVIDHELTHLELMVDDEGYLKSDDHGRPRLKILEHDHQFGWFDSVARRHGGAAYEVKQAKELLADPELAQLYLPGFEVVADRRRAS